jgi:ribosomal protein S20
MRIRPAEPRHSFSIYLPTSLYQKLINKAGRGKINTFIKQVLEEKLITEEQQKKEEFRQKLIADYQSIAKSKKIQKEMGIWDETISDMWRKDE